MIGATWNSRSLARPGRKQAIADFILDQKLNLLAFKKLKGKLLTLVFLNTLLEIMILTGLVCLLKVLLVVF